MARTRTLSLTAAYTGAHYGKSLFWYMTELLFGFYLAEIYGLSPATLGTLLAVFLLWDAVTDPLIGLAIARRQISTPGLLTAQLIGAGLSAGAFWLVFLKPPLGEAGLIGYALALGLAFRTAYTLFDVPQNALMKRLADDGKARLTLSSLRTAFSALATLTISLASALILASEDQKVRSDRFALAAGLFVLIALASAFLLERAGRGRAYPAMTGNGDLGLVLRATLLDPALLRLFLAVFFLSVGWPLFGKLIAFFAAYVEGEAVRTGTYVATLAVAAVLSQPAWIALGRQVSRNGFIAAAILTLAMGAGLFVTLAAASPSLAVASVALLSAGSSALGLLVWTRLADSLSEAHLSEANDVLAFGVFTFASKLALSLGGLMLGATLGFVGYEKGTPLSETGQQTLIWIMGTVPLASALIAGTLAMQRRSGPSEAGQCRMT